MKAQKATVAQQAAMERGGSRGERGPASVTGGTRLVGMPLAAARLVWLLVLVLSVVFFALGAGVHLSNLQSQFPGRLPADLSSNVAGQVLLSPWPDEALMR